MIVKVQKKELDDLVINIFENDYQEADLLELTMSLLCGKGFSGLEALEHSEKYLTRVIERVGKRLDHEARIGITSKYEFHKWDKKLLVAKKPAGNRAVINNKELIKKREEIYEFLKTIHWKKFERVCKTVLELNGVSNSEVTRPIKEGGIDIFGWYDFRGSDSRVLSNLKFRVVAQAKHKTRASAVQGKEISPFITDVSRLKKNNHPRTFRLPEGFLKSSEPIIPIFLTNGYYQKRAIIEADSYNITIWNGLQIAEDLAAGLVKKDPRVSGVIEFNEE